MTPEQFRDLMFSITGLSLAASLAAMIAVVVRLHVNVLLYSGMLLVKLAWFVSIGYVFLIEIVKAPNLKTSWEEWVYLVGLVLGSAGFVIVARTVWAIERIEE